MARRVFITGFGIISAIGNGVEENFKSLTEKRSGIGKVSLLETSLSNYPVGEIKADSETLAKMGGIELSTIDSRTFLIGLIAAKEAVQMSGCEEYLSSMGLVGSNTVGGMDLNDRYYRELISGNGTNKDKVISFDCADAGERIANHLGITRNITTISTACSSSANAIMNGTRMIKNGIADRMLVGGMDALSRFSINGFNSLEILSQTGCKPFDKNRDGITAGEGAAFLVLEAEDVVGNRKIYGEVSGYANRNEAFHATASSPDGEGAVQTMEKALASSHLQPSDIDYINAHGTGTLVNDISEGRALDKVFGDNVPLFSSTKGYTGHTFAAAGAIEAVFSLLAIDRGVVFPNIALNNKLEEMNANPTTELCQHPVRNVLSNSFGFGGSNTTLIFSKI